MAGPRGYGPQPHHPLSLHPSGLELSRSRPRAAHPLAHQAALLAAGPASRPGNLGGASGQEPEPTHVGRHPPLTTWPLSGNLWLLVLPRPSGAPESVDQDVIKPFLLSARTLEPPGHPQRLHPGSAARRQALRISTWGLSTCEPAEPGQDWPVPSRECVWVPRTATWRPPGPLAVAPRGSGSCPLVTRRAQGDGSCRTYGLAWPPGTGGTEEEQEGDRHPSGHLDVCVFWASPRCPVPMRVERQR